MCQHEVLEVDPVVERQLELVVIGAEDGGHVPCVGELVRLARAREADGEGLHRLGHVSRHQRDDQARVETAGEHRAERDVAHQPEPDGLVELLEQALGVLADREARRRALGAGYDQNARSSTRPVLDHERVAGKQLPNAERAASAAPGRTRASGTRRSRRSRARRRRSRTRARS